MTQISQTLPEIATDIDAQLKVEFPDCKFLVIASGREPVNDRITISFIQAPVSPLIQPSPYHLDLNQWSVLHRKESDESVQKLTAEGLKLLQRVVEIALSYRQGNGGSRLSSNFIFHLRVGGLNKPFVVA